MPDTSVSRQKIRDYFESKGISLVSVATYFDIPRQDLIDYLNGKNKVKKHTNTFWQLSTFTKSDRRK